MLVRMAVIKKSRNKCLETEGAEFITSKWFDLRGGYLLKCLWKGTRQHDYSYGS